VVDRHELAVEGADALALSLRDLEGVRADAVLLELGLDQGEGELGADQRDVRLLAQEEGDAADVVLVAMGEDDALDVVETVPDGREVGQDQVDSGLLLLGKSTPQSTISRRPPYSKTVMLRPISPRPPSGVTRRPPSGSGGGGPSSGCG
jgi:hypothetical protein